MGDSELAEAIEKATSEVFKTMMGADLRVERRGGGGRIEDGVVSLVGLTGNWSGTGTISCSPAVAMLVASRLLMLDVDEQSGSVDDDVLDAVAECTNMVVGNIKNILSDHLGEMAISIPTVIYGRNFRFKSLPGTSEEVVVFNWEGHQFEVKVCLAPTFDRRSAIRQRLVAPSFSPT
jgi:chemotaxis protein CheX